MHARCFLAGLALMKVIGEGKREVPLGFDLQAGRPLMTTASVLDVAAAAIAVIFGLSYATVLTLVVVPVLYQMLAGSGDGESG